MKDLRPSKQSLSQTMETPKITGDDTAVNVSHADDSVPWSEYASSSEEMEESTLGLLLTKGTDLAARKLAVREVWDTRVEGANKSGNTDAENSGKGSLSIDQQGHPEPLPSSPPFTVNKKDEQKQEILQTLRDSALELHIEPKEILGGLEFKRVDHVADATPSTPELKQSPASLTLEQTSRQPLGDGSHERQQRASVQIAAKLKNLTRPSVIASGDTLPTLLPKHQDQKSFLDGTSDRIRHQPKGFLIGPLQRKEPEQSSKQEIKPAKLESPVPGHKTQDKDEKGKEKLRGSKSSSGGAMFQCRPSFRPPFLDRDSVGPSHVPQEARGTMMTEEQLRAFQSRLEALDNSVNFLAFMNNGDKSLAEEDVKKKIADLNDNGLTFDALAKAQVVSAINTLAGICIRLRLFDMDIGLTDVFTKCVLILRKHARKNVKYTRMDHDKEVPYDVKYGLPSELRDFVTNIMDSDLAIDDFEQAKKKFGIENELEHIGGKFLRKKEVDSKEIKTSGGNQDGFYIAGTEGKKVDIKQNDIGAADATKVKNGKDDLKPLRNKISALEKENVCLSSKFNDLQAQLKAAMTPKQSMKTPLDGTSKQESDCQQIINRGFQELDSYSASDDYMESVGSSDLGGSYLRIAPFVKPMMEVSSSDEKSPRLGNNDVSLAPALPSTLPNRTTRTEVDKGHSRAQSEGALHGYTSFRTPESPKAQQPIGPMQHQQTAQKQTQTAHYDQRTCFGVAEAPKQTLRAAYTPCSLYSAPRQNQLTQLYQLTHRQRLERLSKANSALSSNAREEGEARIDRWLEEACVEGMAGGLLRDV